ncbi:MAG: hypothetical protein FWD06_10710 [Oscillospiraceae bacterium]|nr:hypothetical protein [Oscillospiraceae bacterium]
MSIFDVRINNTEITLPTDRYTAEQHLCELELDLPNAEYNMQLVAGEGWLLKLDSNFHELNRLAHQLTNMEEYEQETLRAWIATHGGECTVEQALAASAQVDDMLFMHGVDCDEELGEFVLDNDMFEQYNDLPDAVYDMLDRKKVGEQFREMDGGKLVLGGYLRCDDIDPNMLQPEESLPWLHVDAARFCWSRLPQLHVYR